MQHERAAESAWVAAEAARRAGNEAATLRHAYEAASNDFAAREAHRKAACVIFAGERAPLALRPVEYSLTQPSLQSPAYNQGLPSGTIDLRGLRPEELSVVQGLLTVCLFRHRDLSLSLTPSILQREHPAHPYFDFSSRAATACCLVSNRCAEGGARCAVTTILVLIYTSPGWAYRTVAATTAFKSTYRWRDGLLSLLPA